MTNATRSRLLAASAALGGLALLAIGFAANAPVLWVVGLVLAISAGGRWTQRPGAQEDGR